MEVKIPQWLIGTLAVLGIGLVGYQIPVHPVPRAAHAEAKAAAPMPTPVADAPAAPERPAAPRRNEVTVALPQGTFAKQFDALGYASGSLQWTYEDDRVFGQVEVSVPVAGVEVVLSTEAEVAMSSSGTVYGLITHIRPTKLKVNPQLLGENGLPGNVTPESYALVEPLINEVMIDLPFSYKIRRRGDQIVISDYRILLSGPNPLGKLGAFSADGGLEILSYFQALGTAMEGTYTRVDPKAAAPQPGLRVPVNPRR